MIARIIILVMNFALIRPVYSDMETMIVGGVLVNITQVPHAAYLSICCEGNHRVCMWCGASVVNQYILISAAHCFESCPIESTTVLATIGSERKENPTATYQTSVVRVHENYDMDRLDNDISLVTLKEPLQLGSRVKRIAFMNNYIQVQNAYVAGWGLVEESPKQISQPYIKVAEQRLLSRAYCERKLRDSTPIGTICSEGIKGSEHYGYAARGDSGSGLIANDYILIGTVSYKSGAIDDLIVYTDVTYHYDWIIRNIQDLCSQRSQSHDGSNEDKT